MLGGGGAGRAWLGRGGAWVVCLPHPPGKAKAADLQHRGACPHSSHGATAAPRTGRWAACPGPDGLAGETFVGDLFLGPPRHQAGAEQPAQWGLTLASPPVAECPSRQPQSLPALGPWAEFSTSCSEGSRHRGSGPRRLPGLRPHSVLVLPLLVPLGLQLLGSSLPSSG